VRLSVRTCSVFLVFAALSLSRAEEPAPAPEPPTPEETRAAVVAKLIESGVASVKSEQASDGSWKRDAGTTAFCLYVLAHSGLPREDPALDRGLKWLLRNHVRPDCYSASLTIMALFTLDREMHVKQITRMADMLARGQCENGQWTYKLRGGSAGGDNSNTQFALLALWYARQAGVKVERGVFGKALAYFLTTQNEDGGWGYSEKERSKSYGTMVATGLTSLLVSRAAITRRKVEDLHGKLEPKEAAALSWLETHLALDRNPEANFRLGGGQGRPRKEITDSFWRHYWLWSLERAMAVTGTTKLGERDWFDEGVKHLAKTVRDDGSWVGSESPLQATGFALLFLSRATRKAVATEPALGVGEVTPVPR
jgi:hypothetical protein